MSARSLPARFRFTPRCEQFEDRLTPAVTVDLTRLADGTLGINGTNARDRIQIIDRGTDDAGAITVLANGVTIFTSTGAIRSVDLRSDRGAGGNDDVVAYNLIDQLKVQRSVSAILGAGNDRFTADIPIGNAINEMGRLIVVTSGGAGNDTLRGDVNSLGLGGSLGIGLLGDQGNDKLTINAVNGTVIDSKAQFEGALFGGAGNDTLQYGFAGVLRETVPPAALEQAGLKLHLAGGEGRDTINALITLDAPGGKLSEVYPDIFGPAALVNGNGGDDRVRFTVNGTPGAGSATLLDGGSGRDRCRAEGVVGMTLNCEG